MTSRTLLPLTAALLIATATAAGPSHAQTVGYNFKTGDAWIDTRLYEINDYGRRYRDPFTREMIGVYGAPRSLIDDLFGRGWSAGDIYAACSIAHILGLPCINVVRDYDRHPGQGWGAVAKRMGIKPGSPEFHRLKNGFSTSYGHWGYPISVKDNVRVDWSKHGPGKGNGNGNAGGNGNKGSSHADAGHGKGNSGSKGGNGNGNKGNNGKGHGKP